MKKERKEARPKLYVVTRYEALKTDSKDGKGLLDPKNDSQKAAIYRLIARAKAPLTFDDLFPLVNKDCSTKSKNFKGCVRWYVTRLKKDSLAKSVTAKEEAKAA
jgi:hypothetical protein